MYDVPRTEMEELQLLALRNEFWHKLGELVAQTLAKMPAEFHADQLVMLEDLASLHGSDYERHLRRLKPTKRKGWAPPETCTAVLYGKLENSWACRRCEKIWSMQDKSPKCKPTLTN